MRHVETGIDFGDQGMMFVDNLVAENPPAFIGQSGTFYAVAILNQGMGGQA